LRQFSKIGNWLPIFNFIANFHNCQFDSLDFRCYFFTIVNTIAILIIVKTMAEKIPTLTIVIKLAIMGKWQLLKICAENWH